MKNKLTYGIFLAILAAALYAVNSPFSKLLLDYMPSTLMAGFLYVGAGLGMGVIALIRKGKKIQATEESITKAELPHTIAMIVLDIAAPIFLLIGLDNTTAANASLLNNFEIVATAIIALMIFKEKISPRLWAGIFFVVLSCALLSFEDMASLDFSVVFLSDFSNNRRKHHARTAPASPEIQKNRHSTIIAHLVVKIFLSDYKLFHN